VFGYEWHHYAYVLYAYSAFLPQSVSLAINGAWLFSASVFPVNDFRLSVYAITEGQESFNHFKKTRNEKSNCMYGVDDAEHECNSTDENSKD
jgi:hypothetical protein